MPQLPVQRDKGVNMKPTLEEALIIRDLKIKADQAYDALKQKTQEFAEKYGEGDFSYKNPEGEGYFRISLEDNVKKFERGETVFKAASVSKFQLSIKDLKRQPDDLVE
jgi:hypothetical protein